MPPRDPSGTKLNSPFLFYDASELTPSFAPTILFHSSPALPHSWEQWREERRKAELAILTVWFFKTFSFWNFLRTCAVELLCIFTVLNWIKSYFCFIYFVFKNLSRVRLSFCQRGEESSEKFNDLLTFSSFLTIALSMMSHCFLPNVHT